MVTGTTVCPRTIKITGITRKREREPMSQDHTFSHLFTFAILGGITGSLVYLLLTTSTGLY
ncbi:hypothetical protein GCM10007854_16800 [Algimonas porphyrae]|uniref:Uncharacterized protein n=1 Tax=Algimonas porphyrae TaxID=1128113 RepID=A0ABQ5V124_9PROT|nr:hypothetical protein GCM10007854_16800 [Algimonas porphyrae]